MNYQLPPDLIEGMPQQVFKIYDDSDNVVMTSINLDYEGDNPLKEEYEAWLAEGNEPLPPLDPAAK